MNTPEGHSARIAALEKVADQHTAEAKELRTDIRNLTAAVAELSKAVAVLSQRVSDMVNAAEQKSGMSSTHVAASGAAGGGFVAVCIEAFQYLRGMH